MKHSILPAITGWIVMGMGGTMLAQTQVDLRTQSKAVDFREAQSTKPVKSGSALPATCEAAEMFFLTTAPAGSNLYACPTPNTWVVASGGGESTPGGLSTQCQFNDEGNFGGNDGCTYNKTTKVLSVTGGLQSGDGTKSSGLVLPELVSNGSHYFAIYGADSQSADGCIVVSGSPQNIGDVLFYNGSTAMTTEAVPKLCKVMQWRGAAKLTGSGTLNFSALNNGQCGSQTFNVPGAAAGAAVAPGYPAGLESGLVARMTVSATGIISVQLCNFSGVTVDPAPGVYVAAIF